MRYVMPETFENVKGARIGTAMPFRLKARSEASKVERMMGAEKVTPTVAKGTCRGLGCGADRLVIFKLLTSSLTMVPTRCARFMVAPAGSGRFHAKVSFPPSAGL